jgi:hypothetical protein
VKAKYGNRKTVVDGITFASAKEAKRYGELKLLERGEYLSDLRVQPRYDFVIGGLKVCTYVADFAYMTAMGERVEDVKSEATRKLPVYRIKRKLMKAVHNIDVVEV